MNWVRELWVLFRAASEVSMAVYWSVNWVCCSCRTGFQAAIFVDSVLIVLCWPAMAFTRVPSFGLPAAYATLERACAIPGE